MTACGATSPSLAADGVVDYARDIRPILSRNCLTCHGPDESTRESGLRLDLRESAIQQLDSGEVALVPGNSEQSGLLQRIASNDESTRMPPVETGRSLSADEIKLIRLWIDQGAVYTPHWSFEPIGRPEVPTVQNPKENINEIDFFIRARLESAGLPPSPEASRLTLIRRLSLDLTGLPPSPAEVQDFLDDNRADAYAKLVDRLLDSPHFGERWGRHWLDLARYADSDGYLGDALRPYAYRYRDWVIDAINRDLPFDQFTIDQLAGDLTNNAAPEQRIATGFHRNAPKNTEAGFDKEADRVIRTVDRINTVGTVWMGLTVGCAECHSHKYDPISHHEYYQLYAFFNNLDDHDLKASRDILPASTLIGDQTDVSLGGPGIEQLSEMLIAASASVGSPADLSSLLEILKMPSDERSEADQENLLAWLQDLDPERRRLAEQIELMANRQVSMTAARAPTVMENKQSRKTQVHIRGDFRQPGDVVEPGTPAFLPPLNPRGATADRLDLAHWLVDEQNPLTARTTVNQIWKHLFGRGLVPTEDNFGTSGDAPSHPDLLDWLASELVQQGWSRKAMIRLIVNSRTYRQSSRLRDDLSQHDPQNLLLARQSRFRLEAEIIRDLALASSGLLSRTVGGPSILPPVNSRLMEVSRNREWEVSKGSEKYRRGMYILFRRATPYPMLTIFDAPDSAASCADRERSNSPLQALTLLNDPVFLECSQHLGRRLAEQGNVAADEWITWGFWQCLSRPPLADELQRLISFYQEQLQLLQSVSMDDLLHLIDEPVDGIEPLEHAARVMISRGLMNLDEFITRE